MKLEKSIPPIPKQPTQRPIVRIASLPNVEAFQAHVRSLGLELPCDASILTADRSPMAQPIDTLRINGRRIGNRWVIHPMEGWDGTCEGGATDTVRRRWQRFGQSGAKLIFGCEAMAVRPDGRANPHQLLITEQTKKDLAELLTLLRKAHRDRFGSDDDLVVGFQLTHSGRFSRPTGQPAPKIAYRHPILDRRLGIDSEAPVLTDAELDRLVEDFVRAARIAYEVGADFVDIKHCHGYLLHELLSAHTRPGKYGGSFENRTRMLRNIVAAIRADGNPIALAVRLSAFDTVPFHPDPTSSKPGKLGPGIPEPYESFLPYRYVFGARFEDPLTPDLNEPLQFLHLCAKLGIRLVNLTAGSPYYNPHIQRPAQYPPIDGYYPPNDPLLDVGRQIQVARILRTYAPKELILIGTGYTYLQDYLPHVAQAVVREGWIDLVGIGRMALSYPGLIADSLEKGRINRKAICRTFSDCTTAPRLGLRSGCYPLDPFYAQLPDFQKLKQRKRQLSWISFLQKES